MLKAGAAVTPTVGPGITLGRAHFNGDDTAETQTIESQPNRIRSFLKMLKIFVQDFKIKLTLLIHKGGNT